MLCHFGRGLPGLANRRRRRLGLSHRLWYLLLPWRTGRRGRRRLVFQFVDRNLVMNGRFFHRSIVVGLLWLQWVDYGDCGFLRGHLLSSSPLFSYRRALFGALLRQRRSFLV